MRLLAIVEYDGTDFEGFQIQKRRRTVQGELEKALRRIIGAKVRVTAGGRTQVDEVRSGGSYLSQNDLRLHFGLGSAQRVDRIDIDWPSGGRQTLRNVAADRVLPIREAISE